MVFPLAPLLALGGAVIGSILLQNEEREDTTLQYGDIIGISRGLYSHYGVYVSNDSVIHYSSLESDIDADGTIMDTTLETFCRGDDGLFKLAFDGLHRPETISVDTTFCCPPIDWHPCYKIYSPEETVMRARSRLGEQNYNLLSNNCEHFAVWCKTGLSKSYQVEDVIKFLRKLVITH